MQNARSFVRATAASALLCTWLAAPLAGRASPLPEVPESGVDPDVQAALTSAQQLLASGQAEAAVQGVIGLYAATDRFTVAQRQLLAPDAQRLLGEASDRLQAAGRGDLAVMAKDAAWQLGGRAPNPVYSQTLLALADPARKGPREESLYLARRALLADPGNQAAARLDQRLSTNRFKAPGLALVIGGSIAAGAGLLLLAGGLYSSSSSTSGGAFSLSTVQIAGLGALLGGGLLAGGGGILLNAGKPVSAPVSPLYLPALPEAGR
ncbi:MAG: hypothetical protein U1A78_09075 [Polyangia bacterium]